MSYDTPLTQSLTSAHAFANNFECFKKNISFYSFITILFESLFLPKSFKNYSLEGLSFDLSAGPIVYKEGVSHTQNFPCERIDLQFFTLKPIQQGTLMLKVTRRKIKKVMFSLDIKNGIITFRENLSKTISVDDIQDIRVGHDSRNYREQLKIHIDYEDRWFSIICLVNHKLKILHLITPTLELRQQWVILLKKTQRYRIEMMGKLGLMGDKFDGWLEKHWESIKKNDYIQFQDIEKLCKKLHVNASKEYLKNAFNEIDTYLVGKLNFIQFQKFLKLLKERQEINNLFKTYTKSNKDFMNFEEFQLFLVNEQEFSNILVNKEIFKKFSDNQNGLMSIENFTSFLLSDNNPLIITSNTDMSRPLNEYYISSSHNTYLLGKQFGGESSIEGYIKVLQRGCRCIEIDCWDGPDGPLVYHGHCLYELFFLYYELINISTTKILFYDVISAIAKYAFIVSPYPLILSLEVHCSFPQQYLMVSILKEVLGEMLITSLITTDPKILPSPMDLKYKILLKVKKNCKYNNLDIFRPDTSSNTTTDTTGSSDIDMDVVNIRKYKAKSHKKNNGKIIEPLSNLSVYIESIKFHNFSLPESKTFTHVFSFSEKSFNNIIKNSKTQLEKHNVKYLMRLYPNFTRINSTNFEPQQYWQKGVQMVALNWQTNDLGIQINDAMFSGNDGYGYILKPLYLRMTDAKYSEFNIVSNSKKIQLDIKIISAQQLPRIKNFKHNTLNPFVEIEFIMLNNDRRFWRTCTIYNNGYKPIWDETFTTVIDQFQLDFVFLRFNIYNNNSYYSLDDILIATYCLRLNLLLPGYKHIPLNDQHGEKNFEMSSFESANFNINDPLITFKSFVDIIENSSISIPIEILKETFIKKVKNIKKYLINQGNISERSEYKVSEDFLNIYGEFTTLIKDHEKIEYFAEVLNIHISKCSRIVSICQKLFFISIQEVDLDYIMNTYMFEKQFMIRFIMNMFRISADEKHPYYELSKIFVSEFQEEQKFVLNFIRIIGTIEKYIPPSFVSEEFSITFWSTNLFKIQFELLRLVFVLIYYKTPCTLEIVVNWFKLMKESHYFINKKEIYNSSDEINVLQRIVSLSLIISIEIIRPSRDLVFCMTNELLHDNIFYSSPDTFLEVHDTIVELINNFIWSPVVITWGIILHELFIDITEKQESIKEYQLIQRKIFPNNSFEISRYLIDISLKHNVLGMIGKMISSFSSNNDICITMYKMVLRELFRKILSYVKFSDSVVNCFVKIHEDSYSNLDLAYKFWSDDVIMRLLHSARTRFPYDFFSMIRICKSVSSDYKSTYDFLKNISTFTQITPIGFKGYDILEEVNGTLVKLSDDLRIFSTKTSDNSNDIVIPKDSLGRIISYDISPPVIMWNYTYSVWGFLGKILEISLTERLFIKDQEIIIEIILITTNILKSNNDFGKQLIIDMSSELIDQGDIVGIIREICYLSFQLADICQSVRLNLISVSINFLREAVQFSEDWLDVFKLNLLNKNGNSGFLSNIFSSTEVVLADYSVQISFLKLLRILVEKYISTTIYQHNFQNFQINYLTIAIKYSCDIFESFTEWRYVSLFQKYDIGFVITSLFLRILEFKYSLDIRCQHSSIINSIGSLAELILDKFLSQNPNSKSLHTLWKVFEDKHNMNIYKQWVEQTINFIDYLVRIRNWIKRPLSTLERQLFQKLPAILYFLSFSQQYHIPVLQLITNLISSSSQGLSLLAYLSDYTGVFIENLKYIISNPIIDQIVKVHVWKFSSAVMKFQQGLAILLLTGSSSLQKNKDFSQEKSNTSLFELAILELYKTKNISTILNPIYIASFLEFIANAQNYWVSVVPLEFKDNKFWSEILILIDSINNLKSNFSEDLTNICYQISIIAFSVQICTAEIYSQSQTQSTILKTDFKKILLNKLDSYSNSILTISGYRVSLHSNLKKNFEKTYPDQSLISFKNSGIIRSPLYGDEYFYNLDITNIILGNNSVSLAYLNEMREANLNLSLLDAQAMLLRAWIFLCSIIFHPKSLEAENLKTYINIITTALKANSEENIDSSIIMSIACERVELSLFLTMHLQTIKSKFNLGKYFFTILLHAWKAINSSETNFLLSIGTKNSQYTRTILKIIYICLHGINSSDDRIENCIIFPVLIGLSDLVLTRGASKLFSKALEMPTSILPSDIMLFAAIAEEIFDIQGIEALYDTISASMFQHDNFQSVITFFSNIDPIKKNQDNYFFAEASLLFLYVFSSIPSLSEQLVLYGLLNMLVNASICHQIQKRDTHLQSSSTGPIPLDLYQLWVRGILPIVLNLLRYVGNRISTEVLGFLKIYSVQIQTAFGNWNKPLVITSLIIEETFLLVMIFDILHMEKNYNSDYLFNKTELLESITYLLSHPKYLAILIMPVTEMDHLIAAKSSECDNDAVSSEKFVSYISEKLGELRNFLQNH
ncbi:hypothetical protein PMAC_001817 [Pneumocystis sp. 'macacae']|nr:hypothetical protein PMAC_001817 [Pneumocystis sp. 'macacae']